VEQVIVNGLYLGAQYALIALGLTLIFALMTTWKTGRRLVAERLTARAFADAAAGRISPLIGQTYGLARAADAHAGIEARTVFGKTLLLVPPQVS